MNSSNSTNGPTPVETSGAESSRSNLPKTQGAQKTPGHFVANSEEALKRVGHQAGEELKKPTFGAAVAGAAVVGAAVVFGVAEAAVGAAAAYVVYRILKRRAASGA